MLGPISTRHACTLSEPLLFKNVIFFKERVSQNTKRAGEDLERSFLEDRKVDVNTCVYFVL